MPAHLEQTPKNKIETCSAWANGQENNLKSAQLEQTVEKIIWDLLTLGKQLKKDFETCSPWAEALQNKGTKKWAYKTEN